MPTSTEAIELSIVMPCLNEAETLATCIDKAQGYLERSGVVGEVVIADNGSTDGSQDIARAHGARVVDVPAKGYGSALMPSRLRLATMPSIGPPWKSRSRDQKNAAGASSG